ncbi:hypothetical protein [Haladaptatus sp. DYF46]|uniref:hypothetical protein n=1 Tax=Haladaptatus sp. DYF46 TaxID=2886041 RepID=UPI001E328F59|nr:hypothetical protein [Haladaptatus sp. DYF46]
MRFMPARTDPIEALERVSWYLNYHSGETLPLNRVAKATGLAWATVQKYTKAIETIQQLAPQISTDKEGIKVGRRTESMDDLLSDPAPALAVYLFVHAQQKGSPLEQLKFSEHGNTLDTEILEKMESLGWIEMTGESVQLTSLGVQIAGPIYSSIQDGQRSKDVLKVDRNKGEIRAVIDPAGSSYPSPPTRMERIDVTAGERQFNQRKSESSYTENPYNRRQYA